jgi:hypothetical protein
MLDQQDKTLSGSEVLKWVSRDGTRGLLQIDGFTDDPPGVKVRFRLLKQPFRPGDSNRFSREGLTERLDAAGGIGNAPERSRVFARLATDAARAGEVDLVTTALQGIMENSMRDQAALDSARVLARGHLRKQAIEIAKTIASNEMRDQALTELAQ